MKGFNINRQRHGDTYSNYLPYLLSNSNKSYEDLFDEMLKSISELVKDANRYVPAYVTPIYKENIGNLGQFRKLPLISKNIYLQSKDSFISTKKYNEKIFEFATSGTTGTPTKFQYLHSEWQKNYALLDRLKKWAGIEDHSRYASFNGRIIIHPNTKNPPFWRYNSHGKQLLFSAYHLSFDTVKFYLKKLDEYQPIYIDGYPSAVYTFVKICRLIGLKPSWSPKAIVLTAETLHDYQVEEILKYWNTKIFNQYGSEPKVHIHSCEYGTLHHMLESGYAEILDENENPCKPGEIGELVCTSLIKMYQPLIRYKTGDLASFYPDTFKCPCGRSYPAIQRIIGRIDDVIITPEGRYVGRLDPIFKGLSNIIECQIIQEDMNSIIINIVPDKHYGKSDTSALLDNIKMRLGNGFRYRLNHLKTIPRSKNGKFRAVISHIVNKNDI